MATMHIALGLGLLGLTSICACGAASDSGGVDAGRLDVTGVYSCSVEVVDGDVVCGGPVYWTNLAGQSLSLNIAQTGPSLQGGMWGKVLTGTIDGSSRVALQHKDTDCNGYCSPMQPLVIDFHALASPMQLAQLDIRMHQELSVECLKTYRGVCARN